MNKKLQQQHNKRGRHRSAKKKHVITWEILPPGTLKRNPPCSEAPAQRWEEILDICAEIIAENEQQ